MYSSMKKCKVQERYDHLKDEFDFLLLTNKLEKYPYRTNAIKELLYLVSQYINQNNIASTEYYLQSVEREIKYLKYRTSLL